MNWSVWILTDDWRPADLLVASELGIFVGTPTIEDAMWDIPYEGIYDAARSLAAEMRVTVEIRDHAGLPCVKFEGGTGVILFPKSLSDDEL